MRVSWLAGVLAVALVASVSNAALTGWQCADDGDGAVTMGPMNWTHNAVADEYTLAIKETINWSPAHIDGDFTADSELDPTVWILKEITNNTSYAWNGYVFNVFMNKTFSIDAASAPLGWGAVYTQPAALPGSYFDSHSNEWDYKGVVTFSSLAPAYDLAVGATGDFGAKVSFLGSVSFEIEQAAVPEPATLALAALGGLFFMRRRS